MGRMREDEAVKALEGLGGLRDAINTLASVQQSVHGTSPETLVWSVLGLDVKKAKAYLTKFEALISHMQSMSEDE